MRTYQYKAFDPDGRSRRGMVEGATPREARERLAARGLLVERLAPTEARRRLSPGLRAMAYEELAALLRAGVPLVRAFEILMEAPEQAAVCMLLAGTRDAVREGRRLADALSDAAGSITPFEYAVIDAGERSGRLDDMLHRLAGFLEAQEAVRERVHSALIYPAIVMAAGLVVAILMLGLMVPRAARLMAGGATELPALTRGVMAAGQAFQKGWPAVLVVCGVLGVGWVRAWRRSPGLRERVDRMRFRLPVVGAAARTLCALRFARTLAVLLEGGVSPVDAVRLAGRATGSPWTARLAEDESLRIRHGSRLSEALTRIPPVADALAGWVQVGEAGGDLARLLDAAATRLDARWERIVRRGLTVLEPALLLAMGGFVLLVTLAVLLPILKLSQTVAR